MSRYSQNISHLKKVCYQPLYPHEKLDSKRVKKSAPSTCNMNTYVSKKSQTALLGQLRQIKHINHNKALHSASIFHDHIQAKFKKQWPALDKQTITILGTGEDVYGLLYMKKTWPTYGILPNLVLLSTDKWSTSKNRDFIKCSVDVAKSKKSKYSFRNQYSLIPLILISGVNNPMQDIYRKKLSRVRVTHCEIQWTQDEAPNDYKWLTETVDELTIYYLVHNSLTNL